LHFAVRLSIDFLWFAGENSSSDNRLAGWRPLGCFAEPSSSGEGDIMFTNTSNSGALTRPIPS